jgi:hypothetical protein
MPNAKSGAALY